MQHVCGVGRVGTGPMKYTFNFRDIWTQWDYIAEGIGVTLLLAVVTMIAGLTIGALGAAARSRSRTRGRGREVRDAALPPVAVPQMMQSVCVENDISVKIRRDHRIGREQFPRSQNLKLMPSWNATASCLEAGQSSLPSLLCREPDQGYEGLDALRQDGVLARAAQPVPPLPAHENL